MSIDTDFTHRGHPDGFADDPIASHSAQFGLARPTSEPAGTGEPSPAGTRPWGLRAAAAPASRGARITGWSYDHVAQVAVTTDGVALGTIVAAPTADSVSQLDGDEGQSEDWSYDFCPDQPGEPW